MSCMAALDFYDKRYLVIAVFIREEVGGESDLENHMITFNWLLVTFLSVYLGSLALDLFLEKLNARHLERVGGEVPDVFKGFIEEQDLARINRYTLDKINFSILRTITGKIIFLLIVLSGMLPWVEGVLSKADFNFVTAGLMFFAIPFFITGLADLPFDYYHNFVLEERYGFNRSTLKIWVSDILKSAVLTCLLGGLLLTSLLLLIRYAGDIWWLLAWAVFFVFQLLMTLLYPTVIAPLFNKFTPLGDPELQGRIEEMASNQGINVMGIYEMDASKRSRHTNAYFSGLGKTKRIVLFDSLIESHPNDEILAVLAHEIGHLKRGHIKKQVLITGVVSIAFFFLAAKMIEWDLMFETFGFSETPAYIGVFLTGILLEPVSVFISPAFCALSRRFERQADQYSVEILKTPKALSTALKRLASENLSNLYPHPVYALFNYSHPPLVDRIKSIEA